MQQPKTKFEIWLDEMEARQRERLDQVDNVCQKYGSVLQRPDNNKSFALDYKNKIAFCLVAKVSFEAVKFDLII